MRGGSVFLGHTTPRKSGAWETLSNSDKSCSCLLILGKPWDRSFHRISRNKSEINSHGNSAFRHSPTFQDLDCKQN